MGSERPLLGDELINLMAGLPDDQVEVLLAEARRLTSVTSGGEWPPKFFGIDDSKDDRTDDARQVDEILVEGFGARRS